MPPAILYGKREESRAVFLARLNHTDDNAAHLYVALDRGEIAGDTIVYTRTSGVTDLLFEDYVLSFPVLHEASFLERGDDVARRYR